MKRITRLVTAALLIFVLLLTAVPAYAGDNKTPVTGTLYFIGEPENPNSRFWMTGRDSWMVQQCRSSTLQMQIEASDDRLSAWVEILQNCFFHYNPDFSLAYAHLWGKSTIYQNEDFTVPKWDCTSNGYIDSQWNNVTYVICQGVGVNAGLNSKFSLVPVSEFSYALQGYILGP